MSRDRQGVDAGAEPGAVVAQDAGRVVEQGAEFGIGGGEGLGSGIGHGIGDHRVMVPAVWAGWGGGRVRRRPAALSYPGRRVGDAQRTCGTKESVR
ncbi:hypothetical protein [Streptomyces zaomyceticus]|uniref:hypothetical protein n=1 Tax=Streptomyces zaomyceticus TaxID=68286 RepID=UPI00342F5100